MTRMKIVGVTRSPGAIVINDLGEQANNQLLLVNTNNRLSALGL